MNDYPFDVSQVNNSGSDSGNFACVKVLPEVTSS